MDGRVAPRSVGFEDLPSLPFLGHSAPSGEASDFETVGSPPDVDRRTLIWADWDLSETVLYWHEALSGQRGGLGGLERSWEDLGRWSHFGPGNGGGLTRGVRSHYYFTLHKKDLGSATARWRSRGDGEVGRIILRAEGRRMLSSRPIGGGDGEVGWRR